MGEVIESVDLKPNSGGTPYVKNYINTFNKQFSPNMEGHITLDELEIRLKWCTFPPHVRMQRNYSSASICRPIIAGVFVCKTHGVMVDDEIWLRFTGEALLHQEVCLRKEWYFPTEVSK